MIARREGYRRVVHVALGAGAWLLPVLGWEATAVLCAAAGVFNALLLPRLPVARALLREGGRTGHRGIVVYPLVLLLLLVTFQEDLRPTQAAWVALALGDGLAPLFGAWLPSCPWPWNPRKSVLASAASFAVAGGALTTLLPVPLALGAAGAGCVADGIPGEDNVTTPVLAALAVFTLESVL